MIDFGYALFLLPLATALHVRDEWPGFPQWARRFASPSYGDREYITVHALAIAISLATPLLFASFPRRWVAVSLVAFVLAPNLICNALFHIGASFVSRTPCPGVLTSVAVYLPLGCWLLTLALRDGLLSTTTLGASLAVAAFWHTIEVGHNVFKLW
jgi:hypothetical protein